MGRPRAGSVWRCNGKIYGRVTWVDATGKRQEARRRAMDESHALLVCQDMIKEIGIGKRIQPKRQKKYKRNNLQIYCIQIKDGITNPIKIGTSANIPMRIKMILCHQPYPVTVLATWPGNVRDEKEVHRMFRHCHMAREWFRPTSDLLNYILSKMEKDSSPPNQSGLRWLLKPRRCRCKRPQWYVTIEQLSYLRLG